MSTQCVTDMGWFAEQRITAETIASVKNPLASRQGLAELAGFLAAGTITARTTTTEPLPNAGALLDRRCNGGVRGKAVIRREWTDANRETAQLAATYAPPGETRHLSQCVACASEDFPGEGLVVDRA